MPSHASRALCWSDERVGVEIVRGVAVKGNDRPQVYPVCVCWFKTTVLFASLLLYCETYLGSLPPPPIYSFPTALLVTVMASSTDDASSAYASDASSSPPSSHQDLSVPTRPERSRFAVNSAPPASNDALAKTLTRERRRSVLQSNSYKAPPPAPDTNEIWARYVTPTHTRLKCPNALAHSPRSLDHSPL